MRQPVHSRLVYPDRSRLNSTRPRQEPPEDAQEKWRDKSPVAEKSKADINVASVTIGTQVITCTQPITIDNPVRKWPILTIALKAAANDHEASSSKGADVPT